MEKDQSTPSHRQQAGKPDSVWNEFAAIAEVIRQSKPLIKKRWEQKVREDIPESSGMGSPALVNSLEIFLDEVANTLESDGPFTKFTSGEGMTFGHAKQRANLTGYFLTQLLTEYSVLREVMSRVLQEQDVLTFEVHRFIDKAIDSVISTATTEFAKVHEANTKEALRQVQISNYDLEQFAAVTAHDLKSPLATVTSYLDLLSDELGEQVDEEGRGYINTMSKTLMRMRNLVDRILDYARISGVDRSHSPIDLNEVVDDSVQNLADAITTAGAWVQYSKLPGVNGDQELLGQLFQNLIANSIKFRTEESPVIKISAEDRGEVWEVRVTDNGIGFDLKEKDNIFALYKQLGSQFKVMGTGIGLATCRKIVELHGGDIDVDSVEGEGTSFYFTLPKPQKSARQHH